MIPETGFSTICAMLGLEALHFVVHVDFAVCVTRGQKAERSVDCLLNRLLCIASGPQQHSQARLSDSKAPVLIE